VSQAIFPKMVLRVITSHSDSPNLNLPQPSYKSKWDKHMQNSACNVASLMSI